VDLKLETLPAVAPSPGPVLVVVMDGVGEGPDNEGNAVQHAYKPLLDRLRATAPMTTLRAHGTAVGLPSDDDMGNSEVGHNALGSGRVLDQGAKLVNAAIASGAIFTSEPWVAITTRSLAGGALHLLGLLSDGNVHSHIDHLVALIREADRRGFPKVRVHPLLDGRDVPETSALTYFDALEAVLAEISAKAGRDYCIASGGGRMVVTMDRYQADWRIVERGWKAHVLGVGRPFGSAREAIETFVQATPLVAGGNSRGDREMIELSEGLRIIVNPDEHVAEGDSESMAAYAARMGWLIVRQADEPTPGFPAISSRHYGVRMNKTHPPQ